MKKKRCHSCVCRLRIALPSSKNKSAMCPKNVLQLLAVRANCLFLLGIFIGSQRKREMMEKRQLSTRSHLPLSPLLCAIFDDPIDSVDSGGYPIEGRLQI
jgi:hypothetical protein